MMSNDARVTIRVALVAIGICWLCDSTAVSNVLDSSQQRVPPFIPDTVSPQARAALLKMLLSPNPPVMKGSADVPVEWDKIKRRANTLATEKFRPVVQALAPTVTEFRLGDVPVLRVVPKGGGRVSPILVYVHGGAFTLFTAHSTLAAAALMADKTGLTVYSIDYTTAPEGNWKTVTDQVIAAYQGLLAAGNASSQIGIYGDSAGGSIVAGSVLKMRDAGVPMPGAVLLQSPWADVTGAGDSYHTLAADDPMLKVEQLRVSADAYAAPSDQKNAYVSPVYGNYRKGFPPTLIQGGTREIFLSNCVRQYQAIILAGGRAILDLYEGMPHVFQTSVVNSPESDAAYAKALAFWNDELRP